MPPVMPGYQHADTPHESTVAGTGWLYGCHSSRLGDIPRGRTVQYVAQDGWTEDGRRRMVHYATDWLPMTCGHSERSNDTACRGCTNRRTAT